MIRPILRDADTRVGFAELFFDLVFVFAITQVSHLLLHHYSLAGALETHGKLATVTAVQPPARFGNLEIQGDQVTEFTEKVLKHETWINGGFFVFEPGVLDYIPGDDDPLEHVPLTNIARDGQLMAYKHTGFWHPMDTVRDRDHLEKLAQCETPPWMQFDRDPAVVLGKKLAA